MAPLHAQSSYRQVGLPKEKFLISDYDYEERFLISDYDYEERFLISLSPNCQQLG